MQNRKKKKKTTLVFASQLALEMNCKVTGSAKSFLAPVECLFVFLEPVWLVSLATSRLYKLPLLKLNHQLQVPVTFSVSHPNVWGNCTKRVWHVGNRATRIRCGLLPFPCCPSSLHMRARRPLVAVFPLQRAGRGRCLTWSCCQPSGTWYKVSKAQLGFINEDWAGGESIGRGTTARCSLQSLSHQLSNKLVEQWSARAEPDFADPAPLVFHLSFPFCTPRKTIWGRRRGKRKNGDGD